MGKTFRKSTHEQEWAEYKAAHPDVPWGRRPRSLSPKYLHRDGVGKGPGFEYWSRRPMAGASPGSETKRMVNRIERRTGAVRQAEGAERWLSLASIT